jgi:hypothetical protein
MLRLEILYYPTGQENPLRVATVSDERLLAKVAEAAINEAASYLGNLSAMDSGMAEMQRAEVGRLRRVLSMFVPGLQPQENPAVTS